MDSCKKCLFGLKRSEYSLKKYGAYHCSIECLLTESERTPYRRPDECCLKFERRKGEKKNENS